MTKRGVKSAYTALTPTITLPAPKEQASSVTQVFTKMIGDSSSVNKPPLTGDENGIPMPETALKLLKIHVEAINRCKQLVPPTLL